MISTFLFNLYFVSTVLAVPIGIGAKIGTDRNKEVWSQSVFQIVNRIQEQICIGAMCTSVGEGFASGTAFVIGYSEDRTVFMSAAHLCNQYDVWESNPDNITQTLRSSHMYIAHDKKLYEAGKTILYKNTGNDICIFIVDHKLGRKLKIAKKSPKYAQQIWTIGAPAGFFPESAKPINSGYFSGKAIRYDLDDLSVEFFNFSLATKQGMSGSPIMDASGRVVGIVSAVHSEWHMICFSPTLAQIIEAHGIALQSLDPEVP